jgi:hypothetical protein
LRRPLEVALTAAVGVVNRPVRLHLAAPPDRHLQGGEHEVDGLASSDGVAEAVAAPGVLDDRDVGGPAEGDNLREVRHPQLVRPVGGEVPLDEIKRRLRPVARGR